MKAIIKKELRLYFATPIAYVFIATIICVSAILFTMFNLRKSNASISEIFGLLPLIFVITIPILTMRLMSEERALKTDQLLLTAPISITSIVLGKLLSAVAVFGIAILVMIMYPVILSFYAEVAWGMVFTNYMGFFLMGTAFIAVGLFISSLTENQIISAIVTMAVLIASFVCSYMLVPDGNVVFDTLISAVSLKLHFDKFYIGIIDIVDVVYYVSVTAIFVLLTIFRTEKRRISK